MSLENEQAHHEQLVENYDNELDKLDTNKQDVEFDLQSEYTDYKEAQGTVTDSSSDEEALSESSTDNYDDCFESFSNYSSSSDGEDTSILRDACKERNYQKIENLLKTGIDINEKFGSGETALHWAVSCNDKKLTEFLLHHNADINAKDICKRTPLHNACHLDYQDIVSLLLNFGCDINCQDYSGSTPLHLCTSVEVIKLLLLHDANIKIKDKYQKTAFEVFELYNYIVSYNSSKTFPPNFECYLNEAKQMKETKLNTYYTLQDFLFMPLIDAERFVTNEIILEILDDDKTFEKKFLYYGSLLDSKYEKANYRRDLQEQANEVLNFFCHTNIPYLCCQEMFSYFNNNELEKIIGSKEKYVWK